MKIQNLNFVIIAFISLFTTNAFSQEVSDTIKNDTKKIERIITEITKETVDFIANEKGDTALMFAIRVGNQEATRLLIKAGAMLDVVNRENDNPLSIAAKNNNIHVILQRKII